MGLQATRLSTQMKASRAGAPRRGIITAALHVESPTEALAIFVLAPLAYEFLRNPQAGTSFLSLPRAFSFLRRPAALILLLLILVIAL